MSEHIVDLLGDYLESRLEPHQQRALEAHVAACRECAADLAFARVLHEQGDATWTGHLAPDRIVAVASGAVAATVTEEAHLKVCGDCGREADWVRSTPPVPAVAGRKVLSWSVGITAAAAVMAAILLLPRSSDPVDLPALARVEPLPVQTLRGGGTDGPIAELRLRGLESYRDGRYAEAVAALRPAAAAGDPELRLYLASALLLQRQPDEAAAILTDVVSAAQAGDLRDLALWQLANAQLAADDGRAARATLTQLRDLGGGHAEAAAEMLAAIDLGN